MTSKGGSSNGNRLCYFQPFCSLSGAYSCGTISILEKTDSSSEKSRVTAVGTYLRIWSMPFFSMSSVENFLLLARTRPFLEILKKNFPDPVLILVKVKSVVLSLIAAMICSQSAFSLQEMLVKIVFPFLEAKVNL